jgi:hypothetical protein
MGRSGSSASSMRRPGEAPPVAAGQAPGEQIEALFEALRIGGDRHAVDARARPASGDLVPGEAQPLDVRDVDDGWNRGRVLVPHGGDVATATPAGKP